MSIPAWAWDKSLAWRDLTNLARRIFVDRNARGMPINVRDEVRREAQPELRLAIAHVRKARNALRANDRAVYEHMRDVARFHVSQASCAFRHPFMAARAWANDRLAATSKDGAKATAEKFARPGLDELILAVLERGEKTRDYTKEWAVSFAVSVDTVERHIKRVKATLAKG